MWGVSGPLIIKSICATVIAFCAGVIIWTLGPSIETRFFPVVGKLQILRIEELTSGNTAVFAAFEKQRNCEYIGIAWYRGQRDGVFERVAVVLYRQPGDDSSPNRPVGFQKAGPWEVSLSPEQVRSGSFVQLRHTCHPFWTTTTDFWP